MMPDRMLGAVRSGLLSVAVVAAAVLAACEQEPQEWPSQPLTIIVPWAAGGSTDQITRRIARELENELDIRVVVQNTEGAAGAIGTRQALDARPDGYTWTAGAAVSLGLYPVLDLLDTSLDDWHLFLAVANVPVVGVQGDSDFESLDDVLEAMRERPGEVSVGTAGMGSSGHTTMELIAEAADVEYRHVTYDGGNPAVQAAAGGEVQVTTQLASEQVEFIRSGHLRPLAAFADEPLELEGHGTIPPITDWLDDVRITSDYFGIWVRTGVPEEVVERVTQVWESRIAESEDLAAYARENGAFHVALHGDEARREATRKVQTDAWILHRVGHTSRSPEELDIARPGTSEDEAADGGADS